MPAIETDENRNIIASNKVEGTSLLDADGNSLGTVYNVMLDKLTGQVEYVVVQMGDLTGIGYDYYPVPWAALEYDEDKEAYVLDADAELLQGAPRFAAGKEPAFSSDFVRDLDEHYGIEYDEEDAFDENEEDEGAGDYDGADDDTHTDYSTPARALLDATGEYIRHNPALTLGGSFLLGLFVGSRR